MYTNLNMYYFLYFVVLVKKKKNFLLLIIITVKEQLFQWMNVAKCSGTEREREQEYTYITGTNGFNVFLDE